MGIGWPWCKMHLCSGVIFWHPLFDHYLQDSFVLSDTCNNSVNRMKIELTLKADFTPLEGWKLWMSPVASGSSESLFCSLRRVIREEVRHRLQSSISHWRKWYVHHFLCPASSALSAGMHITCVKAARDMTRETESHHTAATQGGVESLHTAARSSLHGDSSLTSRMLLRPFTVYFQIQKVSFLMGSITQKASSCHQ